MGLFNLLIPKEKIVGIEINSQKLRMLYLELDSAGKACVRGKSEMELDDGIIAGNRIEDKKRLSEAIAALKKNFLPQKYFSPFAVVTISPSNVYSEVFEFPESLDKEQLVEAISLNAAENLPLPLSSCYLDWQTIGSAGGKKKVLTSLILKNIADGYINALEDNGFHLIALEISSFSMERAAEIPDDPAIFLYLSDEGLTSMIYYKKYPYLSRFESWKEAANGKEIGSLPDLQKVIKNKINNLNDYFNGKYEGLKIKKILLASHGYDSDVIIKKIGQIGAPLEKARLKIDTVENSDWMIAAGAAARAFVERSDDTIISLLPVGTESLYETQKATSFVKSILLLFFSLSIFYISVFVIFYFFVSSIEDGVDKQLNLRNGIPTPPEYLQMESETGKFNAYANGLKNIYSGTSRDYASGLKDINSLNAPGIILTSLNFDESAKSMSISGLASTRENLSIFRSQMESSPSFGEVKFFIPNIAQKNDITFNVALYHK